MSMTTQPRRSPRGATAAVTLAATGALLFTSACGAVVTDDADAATGTNGAAAKGDCDPSAPLFDQVPAWLAERGCTLTVSSSGSYPPMNFFDKDGKTIIGLQPDLARGLEKQLGIKITYVIANFDAVLGGIASGRYDSAMMTMSDTEERRSQVDFIDYGSAGSSILVPTGNPQGIQGVDDLCGKTVSTVTGYVQVDQLKKISADCTAAGKEPAKTMQFPNQASADQAVGTKRADVQLGDTINSAYSAEQSKGTLELLDTVIEPNPFGMPFRKDRRNLAEAIQAGFAALLENGEFATTAQKWNLASVVPTEITINDGHGF